LHRPARARTPWYYFSQDSISNSCLLRLLGGSRGVDHLPRPRRRLGQRNAGGPIPVPARPSHGPRGGAALPPPNEADGGAHVDEELGGVELARDAELGGGVVEGVLVVPVVPALADGAEGHEGVLGGVGEDVVRVVAHEVGGGVDEPGEVQNDGVAESAGDEEGVPEFLAPEVLRDLGGHDVAHVQGEPRVELLLEHDEGVLVQVREVEVAAGLDDGGVLLDEEPAHVGEEEAAGGVVGVGLGLRELVVDAVVAGPVVDAALVGDGVGQHEEEADGEAGLVRAVGPQPVDADRDAEARDGPKDEGPEERLSRAGRDLGGADGGHDMDQGDVDAHRPVDGALPPVVRDHRRDVAEHFRGEVHGGYCTCMFGWKETRAQRYAMQPQLLID
jgi:hypothetical protein